MFYNTELIQFLISFDFNVEGIGTIEGRRGYFLKAAPSHMNKMWITEDPRIDSWGLNQEHIRGIGFCLTIPTIALYVDEPHTT